MSEFLDQAELRRLTAAAWSKGQAAWLRERGIPHKVEGSRLIVSRVHVRAWLEGKAVVSSNGPNWGAVA